MKNKLLLSLSLWMLTLFFYWIGLFLVVILTKYFTISIIPLGLVSLLIGSIPAFIAMTVAIVIISNQIEIGGSIKFRRILIVQAVIAAVYAIPIVVAIVWSEQGDGYQYIFFIYLVAAIVLFAGEYLASYCLRKNINHCLNIQTNTQQSFLQQTNRIMENDFSTTNEELQSNTNAELPKEPIFSGGGNKIAFKAIITAVLILLMLIPVAYVSTLVEERKDRQQEVIKEVSSKWASSQTITGPYLEIPYKAVKVNESGKEVQTLASVSILPENLEVAGKIIPESRPRSIYKVLLYRSELNMKGNFTFPLPENIKQEQLLLSEARLCVGISDFKGIEEKITINLNGNAIALSPGLPNNNINDNGLSASIPANIISLNGKNDFALDLKIRGSEKLHFIPLSANSHYTLKSTFSNPSFDGNVVPNHRDVSDTGFLALWSFNQANSKFASVINGRFPDVENLAFGVSLVQPADQYAKTSRSVKYAILIIGLTFALFFIIELMQKRRVHPVQYILVGIALVIFYTLLLSISEFLLFDKAYIIAASATVLLITLYVKSHFNKWSIASIFGTGLMMLYGFIFVLIRLEDTALLVGSVGLFVVLAIVMYVSRKINWYRLDTVNNQAISK